jgi:hypothetical protein
MWVLSLLPTVVLTAFVNLVLIAGSVGFIGSYFIKNPLMGLQKGALQVISVLSLVLGVYWYGGINIEKEWRSKVEAAEIRANIAEEKAKIATAKIEYVFQDKVKVVKEVQIIIQEKIRDVSVLIDSQCKITKETIDILNEAARNKVVVKK